MPDFDLAFSSDQLQTGPTTLSYLLTHYQATDPALRLLMTTGDADILRPMDEQFRGQLAAKLGDQFTWRMQPGQHNWALWQQQLPAAMHWLIRGGWRIV